MKGPSGFGAPKRKRFAMQFGYDARPSFWQEVKSNSHLVIAAIGTAALLGVAGTALWLAMPAGDRQAFAQAEQQPPAAGQDAKVEAAGQPALASLNSAAPTKTTPVVETVPPDAEADLAALPTNDPRWSGSTHRRARPPADSAAKAQKAAASTAAAPPPLPTPEQAASVAAYQSTGDAPSDAVHPRPDKAETAAIPTARPAEPADDESAARDGRILRAVTMRSGPKKGASAIGTIPAKTAVQVIGCKSWCEVVYKGKRGFIYKSFLNRGG